MYSFLSLLLSFHILLCTAFIPFSHRNILFSETQAPTEQNTPSATDTGTAEQALSSSVSAPSAVLMEMSTGTVVFEKDSHAIRHPASITKIMTLTLIFEAIEKGQIHLNDNVTVSEHASSMGGSQVFLETGETQTVETLIKCISIASANDACVAMAEFISGSEEAFVAEMNQKAKDLGMKDTTFVNCCGLDADGHLTTAYDVALMSRELTVRHPEIHNYCTVWMDTMTHVTAKGEKEFGLTNTNKLIRQYEYATGLKTGFTNIAKYCVSATAEKNGMKLIAVIMGAETIPSRTKDAITLLNYGFSKCQVYTDEHKETLPNLPVKRGIKDSLTVAFQNPFRYLDTKGSDLSTITKDISLPENVEAPVQKGDKIGEAIYRLGEEKIGSADIIAADDIAKAVFSDYLVDIFMRYFT
ncbi:MAG: D-alanyl-D-alanine carboxypeptidase [Eubacterium sp.]|nr:D-alanyl-D-alanine carboxypeptidase [Eubacterium sp.]